MTPKVIAKAMIGRDTWVFTIKTVAVKSFFLETIGVDKDNMHMEMALIE